MAARRLSFQDAALPASTEEMRARIRRHLADELAAGHFVPRCDTWLSGHDPEFSRRLGAAGFVGLTWPKEYGGHERSTLERFVVVEELLAHGAPIAAHWISDRQSGPGIIKHGTDALKEMILPGMARGETYFSIGMSEPDSGSDLASIRSTATRTEGGWKLNGTKVWTSQAHNNQYFIVLVRTTPASEMGGDRHGGMSQFVMDLRAPGVQIRPIRLLSGHHHFNEVVMEDVFVPDEWLLGVEGNGWNQVIGELAFERSGPERFLSTYPLLAALIDAVGPDPSPAAAAQIGMLVGRLAALRRLCISVATQLDAGRSPVTEAALVKDLGTRIESEIAEVARSLVPPGMDPTFDQLIEDAVLAAPGFTLRGGTNEILRGIVARELGVRCEMPRVDDLLIETIEALLADHCEPEQVGAAEGGLDAKLWGALTDSGLLSVGVAESAGGSGGTLHDAAAIAKAAGRFAAPVPLTETSLIGGWVCEQAGIPLPAGPLAVVIGADVDGGYTAWRVPWAPVASSFVVVTETGVALVDPASTTLLPGANYAGEPYADVAGPKPTLVAGPSPSAVRARGALARSLLMAGALQQAVDLSVQYANEREQFGRPIGKFQVIQNYLAEIAGEAAAAEAAADNAVDVLAAGAGVQDIGRIVGAAKAVTGRAAGIVNRIAHQIHGAIGFTDEHRLQYTTRRLWSWRDEYGTDAQWATVLGTSLCRGGGAALWPTLTTWPRALSD